LEGAAVSGRLHNSHNKKCFLAEDVGRQALWQRGGGILVDAVFYRSNLNSKEYKAQHEKLG